MLEIVKRAQKGDSEAFLALFQKFEKDIYRIAFIYVKNKNDALDVVQETAYRSFKTIRKLKEPQYLKTWLIRITINCAIDLLKKQRKDVQFSIDDTEYISNHVNENIDLELTLEELMNDLNELEKSVVILKYYEDLTFKEIAQLIEIPTSTAKTVLYRALEKLRQKLKSGDDDESKF